MRVILMCSDCIILRLAYVCSGLLGALWCCGMHLVSDSRMASFSSLHPAADSRICSERLNLLPLQLLSILQCVNIEHTSTCCSIFLRWLQSINIVIHRSGVGVYSKMLNQCALDRLLSSTVLLFLELNLKYTELNY